MNVHAVETELFKSKNNESEISLPRPPRPPLPPLPPPPLHLPSNLPMSLLRAKICWIAKSTWKRQRSKVGVTLSLFLEDSGGTTQQKTA